MYISTALILLAEQQSCHLHLGHLANVIFTALLSFFLTQILFSFTQFQSVVKWMRLQELFETFLCFFILLPHSENISPLESLVSNMNSNWAQLLYGEQWFNDGSTTVVQLFLLLCPPPVWLWGPTRSCDCSEHRASRLWMTLVRSRQSMQLLRNVPSWFDSTFPSASTRKYLHPHTHHYFWCRI